MTAVHAPGGTGPQGHLAGAGNVQNVQNILLGIAQGYHRVIFRYAPPPVLWGVGGNCSVYLPNLSVNGTKLFEYPLSNVKVITIRS